MAVLPAHDLRGLVGLEPLGVNRWIGGLGHELGHAFGLRHPPACEMSCPFGPLMGLGYLTYPDAFLLPEDKAILNASPFFTAQDSGTPPTDGHTAAPEPYAFLLLLTGFLPITLMRKWQEPISRADKILDGHESGRGRVTPRPWNRRSRLYADSRRAM